MRDINSNREPKRFKNSILYKEHYLTHKMFPTWNVSML